MKNNSKIKLPDEVSAHLEQVAVISEHMARNLEKEAALYGEGEEDCELDDGTVYEWQVHMDHSEIEKIIANLRHISEFITWLAGGEK